MLNLREREGNSWNVRAWHQNHRCQCLTTDQTLSTVKLLFNCTGTVLTWLNVLHVWSLSCGNKKNTFNSWSETGLSAVPVLIWVLMRFEFDFFFFFQNRPLPVERGLQISHTRNSFQQGKIYRVGIGGYGNFFLLRPCFLNPMSLRKSWMQTTELKLIIFQSDLWKYLINLWWHLYLMCICAYGHVSLSCDEMISADETNDPCCEIDTKIPCQLI